MNHSPTSARVSIPRTLVSSGAPLSFAQQRLWFLDQFERRSALYNTPIVIDLEGPLDVEALRRSLETIVQRHETLRTVFPSRAGEPYQHVLEPQRFPLDVHDCRGMSEHDIDRLIEAEVRRPFDLVQGPLFRAVLLQVGPLQHVLAGAVHHITFDGWSYVVFFRELTTLYRGFVAAEPIELPKLPITYIDFTLWQRDRLQGERLRRQLEFWTEQLHSVPRLELATDFARPAVQGFQGGRVRDVIPEPVIEAADVFARSQGVTLYIVLLSVYATLLHRHSGQEQFIVGSPIANRSRQELEPLIGFFLNTLALRLDLSGEPTFRELLQRVKRVAFAAYGNAELPFEKLVEELEPERSLSHAPLIDTTFVVDNNPGAVGETIAAGALRLRRRAVDPGTAKFDLGLMLFRQDGGRRATLEYRRDLFTEQSASRLLRHFQRLLDEVLRDPDRPLEQLPMLDAGERQLVTSDWNARTTQYPRASSIPVLFEQHATVTPDAPAIIGPVQTVTYAELNARANQIAHYLRAKGIGAEARVGVCLERGVDTLAVLLGILKAGAAYVPLDPTYPTERLLRLIADCDIGTVICTRATAAPLTGTGAALAVVDDQAEVIASYPNSNIDARIDPASLAYVLFTSGSTGEPKAVGVPHRAIVRLAYGMPEVSSGAGARVLHLAPLAFDASTFEIWAPLLQGGCVVVAPHGQLSVSELESIVTGHAVTVLWLTASLFNTVVDERPTALSSVKYLLTGGEALSVTHVERALAALPNTTLINGYGPTETTTFATYFIVPREPAPERASIPIGVPLANTRVYILDRYLQPVPVGVPGELWIGGDGVARGYLNDPALTAERFVADPFLPEPDARMYRSGDRARYLPDGTIEFLGRLDDQVKIRGHRIEPAEVEAALIRHERVLRAAVAARDLPGLGRSLVAYIVSPPDSASPDPAELRQFMSAVVPSYLVPSLYVPVASLPLTANGKIDRRALPVPVADRRESRPSGDRPLTPTEDVVAAVWRQVLKLERIDPDTDFFTLGGHSLLATQVVSRLSDAFGFDLEVRSIFEAPTVAALAALIEHRCEPRAPGAASASPVGPAAADRPAPLSSGQQRLWFLHHWDPTSGSYNVPLNLRLTGDLDTAALDHAVRSIVQRHEVLRTVFPMRDGQPFPQVLEDSEVPITVIDVSANPSECAEEAIAARIATETARPFDLARGPLVRAMLLKRSESEHVFTITMHHIVTDGWSRGLLLTELQAFYAAAHTGTKPLLPPITSTYRDYAAWQQERLASGAFDVQLDYWKAQLPAPHPILNLPLDYPRPAQLSAEGGHIVLAIAPDVRARVEALAQAANATTFMTLLAAFMALLHGYTGQEDIRVGTPVAGRTRPELEPVMGFFVNTLVMRGLVRSDLTFRELVAQVRQTAIDAYAHQELPFEKLVDELHPQRTASHAPLVQAMFVLQNAPRPALRFPGLQAESITIHSESAKFDLIFSFTATETGFRGTCEYAKDLFRQETVAEMVRTFQTVLVNATASPDTPLRDLAGVTPARTAITGRPPALVAHAVSEDLPRASRDIEEALTAIWQRVLDLPHVGSGDNFFDLGGHSLLAVRLFNEVETRLGARLPLSTIFRDGTIREQARLIEQATRPGEWSPLVAIQPDGNRAPFFLVHGIGGEVLSFAPLAARLGPDQPVYGLQARTEQPERFFSSIEEVAATYVRAMRRISTGPYRIGGYSAGGVVALEMAQQLTRAGEDVALLAMIDCPVPGAGDQYRATTSPLEFARRLAYWTMDDDFLSSGTRAAFMRIKSKVLRARDRLRRSDATDGQQPKRDIRHALGVWRFPDSSRAFLEAYVDALNAYRAAPYPGQIAVIRSRTGRFGRTPRFADLGWASIATRGTEAYTVPAAHDTMLFEPRVRWLAGHLTTLLEQSERAVDAAV